MAYNENDLLVGPTTPASGVTTISVDFLVEDSNWLEVYTSDSDTPLTIEEDFTFAGEGTSSGTVTLTTPADGVKSYSVYYVVPLDRSSDLQLRGEFRSGPVNLELDRLWQAMQGLKTAAQNTLRVSRTSTSVAALFTRDAAARAGRALQFTTDGLGLEVGPTSSEIAGAQSAAERAETAAAAAVEAEGTITSLIPRIITPFVGDGIIDTITVTGVYQNKAQLNVFVAGLYQDNFTLSNDGSETTLTFDEPFAPGANVSGFAQYQVAGVVADPGDIILADDRTLADMAAETPRFFSGRAAFTAATIPSDVTEWTVYSPAPPAANCRALRYVKADAGTVNAAITSANGVKGMPANEWTPAHWAENTTPGTTLFDTALSAMVSHATLAGAAGPLRDWPSITIVIDQTYAIASSHVWPRHNVTLTGQGGRQSGKLLWTGGNGTAITFGGSTELTYDCSIKNLSIHTATNPTSGAAVRFERHSGGDMHTMDIEGFYDGVHFAGAAHINPHNIWVNYRNRTVKAGRAYSFLQCPNPGSINIVKAYSLDVLSSASVTGPDYESSFFVESCDGVSIFNAHGIDCDHVVHINPTGDCFLNDFVIDGIYCDRNYAQQILVEGTTSKMFNAVRLRNVRCREAGQSQRNENLPEPEGLGTSVDPLGIALDINTTTPLTNSEFDFDLIEGTDDQAIVCRNANLNNVTINARLISDCNQAGGAVPEVTLRGTGVKANFGIFDIGNAATTANVFIAAGATGAVRIGTTANATPATVLNNNARATFKATIDEAMPAYNLGTLTIATGAIAIPTSAPNMPLYARVATEAAASVDDLDSITGAVDGDEITLQASVTGQRFDAKNGTGNITCGADRVMNHRADLIRLRYDATDAAWNQVSWAGNA